MSEQIKRQKTEATSVITKFEELPNELILFCFRYLNFYHLYEAFSYLNQRFNNLILSHPEIHLDFRCIPIEKFLTFCCQLNHITARTNNYPVSIRVKNNERFSLIFEDDLFKNEFSRIKSLKIVKSSILTLSTLIFGQKTNLCETLERLTYRQRVRYTDHIERFCSILISSKMKSLKYLHINLSSDESDAIERAYWDSHRRDVETNAALSLSRNQKSLSNLERIILGDIPDKHSDWIIKRTSISFKTMIKNLLPYVPKLKHLFIHSIVFDKNDYRTHYMEKAKKIIDPILPENLKVVNLWIETRYNKEKYRKLLKDFFGINNSFDMTTIKTFKINNKDVLNEQ